MIVDWLLLLSPSWLSFISPFAQTLERRLTLAAVGSATGSVPACAVVGKNASRTSSTSSASALARSVSARHAGISAATGTSTSEALRSLAQPPVTELAAAQPNPERRAVPPLQTASGSSGSAVDVQKQLLRLHNIMHDVDDGVTEADILKVLGRVQRTVSVIDEVVDGVTAWTDAAGVPLIPMALRSAAKRFLATLDVSI